MIIGHQKQREFLKEIAKREKVSRALLFTGQEKIGKRTVAFEWSNILLKGELKNGQHPDLILITPQDGEIKISQIRDLNWRLSLKPYSAPFKIAIIDRAQRMNAEAQNSILKTLEEPKGNTCLILITEYPELLLPTIRSRCEIIKFYPVPRKEIKDYLVKERLGEREIKLIIEFSQGKPGMAIDFLNQPQKLKERMLLLNEIAELEKGDLITRFQYVKRISKTLDSSEVLKIWLFYFREKLISILDNMTEPKKREKLVEILKEIQDISYLMYNTNINRKLALEILMLKI